jgi:hypothetical protein
MEISKKEVTTACCVITQKTAVVSNFAVEACPRHAFDTTLEFCLKFAKGRQTFCTKALYELLSASQAKFLNIYRKEGNVSNSQRGVSLHKKKLMCHQ